MCSAIVQHPSRTPLAPPPPPLPCSLALFACTQCGQEEISWNDRGKVNEPSKCPNAACQVCSLPGGSTERADRAALGCSSHPPAPPPSEHVLCSTPAAHTLPARPLHTHTHASPCCPLLLTRRPSLRCRWCTTGLPFWTSSWSRCRRACMWPPRCCRCRRCHNHAALLVLVALLLLGRCRGWRSAAAARAGGRPGAAPFPLPRRRRTPTRSPRARRRTQSPCLPARWGRGGLGGRAGLARRGSRRLLCLGKGPGCEPDLSITALPATACRLILGLSAPPPAAFC